MDNFEKPMRFVSAMGNVDKEKKGEKPGEKPCEESWVMTRLKSNSGHILQSR
jgi:hypothetical protein